MYKNSMKELKLKQLSESINKMNPISIDSIGQRLKDIRETLGMTQKQVADKLKVKRQVIIRIEKDAQSSSLKTISKIVKALNCEFMGVFTSTKPLELIIKIQAEHMAKKILNQVYSNMAMEKQAPDKKTYNYELKKLVDELVSNPNSKLWEE